ncbi:MAG: hypothetical protein AAB074_12855 [Planctomycetota bacterium]
MAAPADSPRSPWRLAARWRIALFLAALASLPILWLFAGGGVGVAAERAELDRARRAMAEGRFSEARIRAEVVLARRPAGPDSPAEHRAVAGDASLLAAAARLEEAGLERAPLTSALEFAAWRAAQASSLGADAREARRLRLAAARRMIALGYSAEAIAELEKLETARDLGSDGRRDLALALASGNADDRARAVETARRLVREDAEGRERGLSRRTLGRVLARIGQAEEAEAELSHAADELKKAGLDRDAAEARLDRGGALISLGRAPEAAVLLRALLSQGPGTDLRERAGIALLEAGATSDDPLFHGDFSEFRNLPASAEALFAARARIARRRLEAGRRADAAAAYAAAFEHLGARPFPAALVPPGDPLSDLENLFRYGPDPNDLPALARASEGLAHSLGDSEAALELAAAVAARRAELADERARTSDQAGTPAAEIALEARALHGRAAELRLHAADGPLVVKSRSSDNRFLGARELFLGGFHQAAVLPLRRLAHEFGESDERSAEARWLGARSLQELGRHDEAVTELAKFLEEHRNAPRWAHEAFVALARSQEALGNLEAAERTLADFLFGYDNVTPEAPRWRDALFALGEVQARISSGLRAAGRDSEAAASAARSERNLVDAVRRFPAAWAQRFTAEATLGRLSMTRRAWDEAAKRLRSALALPGRARDAASEADARRTSLLLGESLWQVGETAGALEAFGQAWATKGGSETAVALARMADCHEKLGDLKQAARFRERAKAALDAWKAGMDGGRAEEAAERLLERLVVGR